MATPSPWSPADEESSGHSLPDFIPSSDPSIIALLADLLGDAWQLDPAEEDRSRNSIKTEDWTITSLIEAFLSHRLDTIRSSTGQSTKASTVVNKVATLSEQAAGAVLAALELSDNVEKDIKTIINSLTPHALYQLFRGGRAPYTLFRAFSKLSAVSNGTFTEGLGRLCDIDESVLLNERYIRSRTGKAATDDKYLVTLKDLCQILKDSDGDGSQSLSFRRKNPPAGGFEMLDELRKQEVTIIANDEEFGKTFARITGNVFKGLDWANVFVAGGMALTTLLHIDQLKDNHPSVMDCDIDIYIYGLDAQAANAKLEHIYDTWISNLPASRNTGELVVKSAKTITFFAEYPNRRLQIVLKLQASPTQILLNFDLDACAVGWNGRQVLMLPRFARAIETGYSIFTMDLVWGHYLSNRRETREQRVFKYADRGFGLRILPSYVKSLEDTSLDTVNPAEPSSNTYFKMNWPDSLPRYETRDEFRRPQGPEPGLKTLKRVAYLGADFTNRYAFGITALADTELDYDARLAAVNRRMEGNDTEFIRYRTADEDILSLAELDSARGHDNFPYGRKGLGIFELFMRHCEAWRLDARNQISLLKIETASNVYDLSPAYSDTVEYYWNPSFTIQALGAEIDRKNASLFEDLKQAICEHLGIPYQGRGYRGYLSRRILDQVHGPDLKSVMKWELTIPLMIPSNLERSLIDYFESATESLSPNCLPSHFATRDFLMPIQNAAPNSALLPPLQEAIGEAGNLRYWVITNESMWACQNRLVDELFEVFWSLHYLLQFATALKLRGWASGNSQTRRPEAIWHLARAFRWRGALSEIPSNSSQVTTSGLLRREALLFRAWAFALPNTRLPSLPPHYDHADFKGDGFYIYPVPDELFWTDGDQGQWDDNNVPSWQDPVPKGRA